MRRRGALSSSGRHPALVVLGLGLVLLAGIGSGCVTWEARELARERVPLSAGHLDELTPRHDAWGFRLELVETSRRWQRYIFRFETYDDSGGHHTVRGDWYAPEEAFEEPAPLLVLSPILAGPVDDYRASRFLAKEACKRGISAFFLHQETTILDPTRDALALERRLLENVRDNRKALDLFARRREVDRERLGSFGVSLGAIKNVALIAAEPRLRANVLVLAGGDLTRILGESREGLVERYLESRGVAGANASTVAQEFRRWIVSEPLVCARAIDPRRVRLYLGRFDNKVPYESGLLLRCALGEPQTTVAPVGHYTAVLAIPGWVPSAFAWIEERWRSTSVDGDDAPLFLEAAQRRSIPDRRSEPLDGVGSSTRWKLHVEADASLFPNERIG